MWIKIGKWNASFGQKERTFAVIHSVWLISGWYLSLLHVVIIWQLWKKSPSLVSLGYYLYYLRADWKIASKKRSAFQNWKGKKKTTEAVFLFVHFSEWWQKHLPGPKQNKTDPFNFSTAVLEREESRCHLLSNRKPCSSTTTICLAYEDLKCINFIWGKDTIGKLIIRHFCIAGILQLWWGLAKYQCLGAERHLLVNLFIAA